MPRTPHKPSRQPSPAHLRLGVLDGWRGFLIAMMSAFSEFIMASKLLEHYRKQLHQPNPPP